MIPWLVIAYDQRQFERLCRINRIPAVNPRSIVRLLDTDDARGYLPRQDRPVVRLPGWGMGYDGYELVQFLRERGHSFHDLSETDSWEILNSDLTSYSYMCVGGEAHGRSVQQNVMPPRPFEVQVNVRNPKIDAVFDEPRPWSQRVLYTPRRMIRGGTGEEVWLLCKSGLSEEEFVDRACHLLGWAAPPIGNMPSHLIAELKLAKPLPPPPAKPFGVVGRRRFT